MLVNTKLIKNFDKHNFDLYNICIIKTNTLMALNSYHYYKINVDTIT